jgi:hypothetical protein
MARWTDGIVTLTGLASKLPQFCSWRCSIFNHLAGSVETRKRLYCTNVTMPLGQIHHQVANLPRPFPASTSNRIFGTHRQALGCI